MNKYKQIGDATYLDVDVIFPLIRPDIKIKRNHRQKNSYAALVHIIITTASLTLASITTVYAATNVPTDLGPSPLFGAQSFSQQMLRFEEFGTQTLPSPTTTGSSLPIPVVDNIGFRCLSTPDTDELDDFLDEPLHPAPTEAANTTQTNPWNTEITTCLLRFSNPVTGPIEGRPPGINFSHQRWSEFPPQVYAQTATTGSRINGGIRDDLQLHDYNSGEFGPEVSSQEGQTGLYHNTVGGLVPASDFDGKTEGIAIKFHPLMPEQDPLALWTFDGTFPPKLLMTRYGVPTLFRHYNALPITLSANRGFGEHTLTTHEHNGHQPGESDGFAGAYFFPGQFYDYRWPMQLAGYDFINTDATDKRASTPCEAGEMLMIPDSVGVPTATNCDSNTGTINIAGDWHETMSTHWFHDHMIDRTAQNVYKGSAAMMNYYSGMDRGNEAHLCNYDDPKNNINLCFPSGTGLAWGNRDYDINLLIADKAWDQTGQLTFSPLNTDGFLGDVMTTNWLYNPYFDVRARRYRLRILNGSVSRYFKIALVREFNDETTGDMPGPNGSGKSYSRVPFHMIANDGNIMEHAVPFPNAQSNDIPVQGIAERYDIIVDFDFPAGTKLYMVNTLPHDDGQGPETPIPLADILSGLYTPLIQNNQWVDDPLVSKFLEFRVQAYTGNDQSMNPVDYELGKLKMIPLIKFTDAELAAAKHRTFEFGTSDGTDAKPWTIITDGDMNGGLSADVHRVSAAPEHNELEIWHIVNKGGGWAHPVHVHFEEGQILKRDEHHPPIWEMGARKDIYRISGLGELPELPGDPPALPDSSMTVDVAIRFREFRGTYVEHCHNTQHEDTAMLLRWDVENPGQTIRIPTPNPTWDGVEYDGDPGISTVTTSLATIKTGNVPVALTFMAPLQLSADMNNDTVVDLEDFGILKTSIALRGLWTADINEDEIVDLEDFGVLKTQVGQSTGFPLAPNNLLP